MLMRRIAIISTLLFILGGGVALAQPWWDTGEMYHAQQGPGRRGPGGFQGGRGNNNGPSRFMEALDLTPEQVEQMQDIRNRYQPQMKEKRDEMQTARESLHNLMMSDASSEEVQGQYEQVSRVREEMARLHFESMLEMREVLTPEQRQEFGDMMEQRRGSRGPRGPQGQMNQDDYPPSQGGGERFN